MVIAGNYPVCTAAIAYVTIQSTHVCTQVFASEHPPHIRNDSC